MASDERAEAGHGRRYCETCARKTDVERVRGNNGPKQVCSECSFPYEFASGARLRADGGEDCGCAIKQISGTIYTVDGSGTDTFHLTLDCPHVDERLIHGDYDVSADGPRPIKTENVSDRFLAEASLCGTCRRLFPEEVKARVA